jgi:hypothetical protein
MRGLLRELSVRTAGTAAVPLPQKPGMRLAGALLQM